MDKNKETGVVTYRDLNKKAPKEQYYPREKIKDIDNSPRKITRRKFLKIFGGTAAGVATSGIGLWTAKRSSTPDIPPVNEKLPNIPSPESASAWHIENAKNALNNILAKPHGTPERYKLEQEYISNTSIPEQLRVFGLKHTAILEVVDLGLMVIDDKELRMDLVRARYELRQMGTEGLRKLTQEELTWSAKHNIHPEILAVATDQFFEAKRELQQYMDRVGREAFMEEFRPDLVDMVNGGNMTQAELDKITIDDMLPNPGAIAGLIRTETPWWDNKENRFYGFCYLGDEPAINNLDPRGRDYLAKLTRQISEETGLEINAGDPLGSFVGAIGPQQFLPETALELKGFIQKHLQFIFNPLDVKTGVRAVYIKFAQGHRVTNKGGEPDHRFGYLKGEKYEQYRIWAAEAWNKLDEEVQRILGWAGDYWDKIIAPSPDRFNNEFEKQY